MRFTIRETEGGWVLARGDEQLGVHTTYDAALIALAAALDEHRLAAADDAPAEGEPSTDGLLADRWTDGGAGIAFSELLPGGRDFTEVAWSWRDPTTSLLPLMYQNETEMGHYGATLVGFIEQLSESAGTVHAAGRFYDSESAAAARDLLLDGRRFGVSVDPSEAVDAEFVCTEVEDDGWCVDGVTKFTAYEIAGLTMTPFPAFANAAIVLDGGEPAPVEAPAEAPAEQSIELLADDVRVAVYASASTVVPPREWLMEPEPEDGDDRLVEQGDGTAAVPLTISDDGQVFGHLARWGQCHVGYQQVCVSPPESASAYAHFHVGAVRTDDGATVATGALTIGCEHAPAEATAWQARDHYANAGSGWADVRVTDGQFGPWVAGVLRPDVDDVKLRVLRALTLSGDWRKIGGRLDLIGGLAVNTPGFPIARDAIIASGYELAAPMPGYRVEHGEQVALVASGLVARCADCAKRLATEAAFGELRISDDPRLDRALDLLALVEHRTRHLIPVEAASRRAQLGLAPAAVEARSSVRPTPRRGA